MIFWHNTQEESEVDKYEIGPNIMRAEVLKAIEELKTGKAEGTDNIPAEMLKTLKGLPVAAVFLLLVVVGTVWVI